MVGVACQHCRAEPGGMEDMSNRRWKLTGRAWQESPPRTNESPHCSDRLYQNRCWSRFSAEVSADRRAAHLRLLNRRLINITPETRQPLSHSLGRITCSFRVTRQVATKRALSDVPPASESSPTHTGSGCFLRPDHRGSQDAARDADRKLAPPYVHQRAPDYCDVWKGKKNAQLQIAARMRRRFATAESGKPTIVTGRFPTHLARVADHFEQPISINNT